MAMSRTMRIVLAIVLVGLLALGASAAYGKTYYTISKPKVNHAPMMNKPFTVSGWISPKAKSGTKVKILLLMKMGGMYKTMDRMDASVSKRNASSSKYSKTITIPMMGAHAVQAIYYRNGKIVARSKITYLDVK